MESNGFLRDCVALTN